MLGLEEDSGLVHVKVITLHSIVKSGKRKRKKIKKKKEELQENPERTVLCVPLVCKP